MLADTPITAFVATTRPDEALRFYRDVLGLRFLSDDGFALQFEAGGNRLRVQKAKEHTPAPQTVLGWHVRDIAAMIDALATRGVRFEHYPFMPDGARHWDAPGGAKVAWFKDPDGNVLSLDQS